MRQGQDHAKQQVSLIISDKIKMGGIGSGRGSRRKAWRSKTIKTERFPSLDVTEVIKSSKTTLKNTFQFKNIELIVGESAIALKSLEGKPLQAGSINISSMPCHYGGFRYFVCCPYCEKRVRTLYLYNMIFACRHCFKMCYWSQYHTLFYRLLLKRKIVGDKIINDEWTKPKWMRQRTFKRLRSEYFDLDEKIEIAHFFSLRSIRQVDKLFEIHGCAISAAEAWGAEYLQNQARCF